MTQGLTRREWRAVAGMAGSVIGLHAVGFFVLVRLDWQHPAPGESVD